VHAQSPLERGHALAARSVGNSATIRRVVAEDDDDAGSGAAWGAAQKIEAFKKAFSACLEAKKYTVKF
jgi:hypothetical protein